MLDHYPNRLVPNKNQPLISEVNRSHHLGICVNSSIELKDGDNKLNAAAIDLKRIPQFSINKIPDSIITDLDIEIKKEFLELYSVAWQPGQDGITPDESHFNLVNNRNHYFLKISDIHEFSDNYYNPPNNNTINYTFTVKVVHKPLVSNYWHVELLTYSPSHEIINSNSTWKKLICSSIRDRIQEKAVFEIKIDAV